MNARQSSRRWGRRSWTLVLGVALVLGTPGVAAEPIVSGELLASSVATTNPATQSGTLSLLQSLRPTVAQGAAPSLHVKAAQLTWTQAEDAGPAVSVPSPTGGDDIVVSTAGTDRTVGVAPKVEPQTASVATFQSLQAQPQFQVHVYTFSPLTATATLDQATLTALQRPHISKAAGITEAQASYPTDDPSDPPPIDFAELDLPGRMVRTAAVGATQLVLEGDFVVELWGVMGTISGAQGTKDVRSGTWRESVGGAPTSNAYREVRSFVRITVEDGQATFSFPAEARTQWAGPAASLDLSAPAVLASATGRVLTTQGDDVAVQAAQFSIDGRNALAMDPEARGLRVAVTGLDEEGQPLEVRSATIQGLPASMMVGSAVVLAAVAAGAAGAWAVQRRLRRRPGLADVEASLEAGHYRRAAREAARILRSRPGLETAVISRAIALSKSGRNKRLVREVEGHLKTRSPSDGVLHYVLGIAYAELGRQRDAEVAFQEALERTPALLPEVQGRIPSGSRLPLPSVKSPVETHGYA